MTERGKPKNNMAMKMLDVDNQKLRYFMKKKINCLLSVYLRFNLIEFQRNMNRDFYFKISLPTSPLLSISWITLLDIPKILKDHTTYDQLIFSNFKSEL